MRTPNLCCFKTLANNMQCAQSVQSPRIPIKVPSRPSLQTPSLQPRACTFLHPPARHIRSKIQRCSCMSHHQPAARPLEGVSIRDTAREPLTNPQRHSRILGSHVTQEFLVPTRSPSPAEPIDIVMHLATCCAISESQLTTHFFQIVRACAPF